MGSQDKNKCSACEGEQVILENVSRDLALMRFLQLQQCGEQPVMCENTPDRYTVCCSLQACAFPQRAAARLACA